MAEKVYLAEKNDGEGAEDAPAEVREPFEAMVPPPGIVPSGELVQMVQ